MLFQKTIVFYLIRRSFRFCVTTWRAAQRSLSKRLTFLWFALLWSMAPLFGTHTKNTTVIKLKRVQRWAARFVKSRYSRYSSVSDMFDVLGWTPLSQRRQEARLILFNKLLTVWHKCPSKASLSRRIRVLEENTTWNLDRLAIQLASMDSRFS